MTKYCSTIRDIFEEEKCNPIKYTITFCMNYYENNNCLKTCYFAKEKEKEILKYMNKKTYGQENLK